MAQTLVDALAVAAVGLVDDLDNVGVPGGVVVRDGAGVVLGAVVDDDDLHPLSAGEKAVDAAREIVLGVVAGYGDSQQLHVVFFILL